MKRGWSADPMFHKPVMLKEVLESLKIRAGGIYVDGTVGGGGHALEILKASAPDGLLIGIDQDGDALSEAERVLSSFGHRKILCRGNFADLGTILASVEITGTDGILLDLGVSSHQLDTAERGFSFSQDALLDMRMDTSSDRTAYDMVNGLPGDDLEKILRDYGEEIRAGKIAKAILEKRRTAAIKTPGELAGLVARCYPPNSRRGRIHPATKTFQALRIAVNDELRNLHKAVNGGIDLLVKGGRFSIISFHSLEDRIVKNLFRSWERGCICPPDFPICGCKREGRLKVLTRKTITPGEAEVAANPRARSARLRTAERI
jgi:16S rRNA (cytosine1402-N4)-methyltransferase